MGGLGPEDLPRSGEQISKVVGCRSRPLFAQMEEGEGTSVVLNDDANPCTFLIQAHGPDVLPRTRSCQLEALEVLEHSSRRQYFSDASIDERASPPLGNLARLAPKVALPSTAEPKRSLPFASSRQSQPNLFFPFHSLPKLNLPQSAPLQSWSQRPPSASHPVAPAPARVLLSWPSSPPGGPSEARR